MSQLRLPGKLHVTAGLSGKPSLAKCICIVALGKQQLKTRHSQNGVSPTWSDNFILDINDARSDVGFALYDFDTFLGGSRRIISDLSDEKLHDFTLKLYNRNGETIRAELKIKLHYTYENAKPISADDFDVMRVLGRGSFGKVLQVRKQGTSCVYAMKVIKKEAVVARQEVDHTMSEQSILKMSAHPFIVGLKYSFQTPEKLYLVMDYINGGELFVHLSRAGGFPLDRVRLYGAELVLALEHLHKNGIVYRDLKTENILLDMSGHIVLTDFGLSKEGIGSSDTTKTFCGTPEYLGYGKNVDWWALGTLMYELFNGLPPFYDEDVNKMYKKAVNDPLTFPPGWDPDFMDLLTKLLQKDPKKRLGNGDVDSTPIKAHPFFKSINWLRLFNRQIEPDFKPTIASANDTSNFDESFTTEPAVDSVVEDSILSASMQEQFKGFTFTDTSLGEK